MKKFFVVLSAVFMFGLSAEAAPGGASATAKGHGAAVKAAAKDPARVKGAGGLSGAAKGHGATVSGSVKKAPKAPVVEAPEVEAPVVEAPVVEAPAQ